MRYHGSVAYSSKPALGADINFSGLENFSKLNIKLTTEIMVLQENTHTKVLK